MDFWLQEKYVLLLSNRLEGFKRKSSSLFNFRCPYCGDSKQHKHKARGYLYKKKDSYSFHCHNCGLTKGFDRFLKEIEPQVYFEMKKEWLASSQGSLEEMRFLVRPKPQKQAKEDVLAPLTPLDSLGSKHPAKAYFLGRKLPPEMAGRLYYCKDYREFVNSLIPDKLDSFKHAVPRIVIPFVNRNDVVFGFQGRALDPNDEIRYLSIILDDAYPKAYNLNRVDFNRTYYVFEGPFDSMFIPNSIAACGSDVLSVLNSIGCNRDNGVIVFDNEARNPQIVNNIGSAIDKVWTVCVWPSYWPYKDVNDAILAGESADMIKMEIDNNTYSGMRAKLELADWRKDAC